MVADLEKTCTKCHQKFWFTAAEQTLYRGLKRRAPNRCSECRGTAASSELSSSLATFEQIRAGDNTAVASFVPDASSMFKDIHQLLGVACSPIQYRSRTFWEWIRGIDLESMQVQQKLRAGEQADRLLQQRLAFIRHFQEVARAMQQTEDAQIARRQRMLQAYLEELKLEEEIARQQALRDERLKTQQLEETRKQTRLLNEINPPAPPRLRKQKDPVKQAIDDHRDHLRARNTVKQRTISDFLFRLRKLYDGKMDDTEKAARIRALMDAYRQEFDGLPTEVRKFLDWVEDEPEQKKAVNE